jgi:hypothetical protein
MLASSTNITGLKSLQTAGLTNKSVSDLRAMRLIVTEDVALLLRLAADCDDVRDRVSLQELCLSCLAEQHFTRLTSCVL